MALAPDGMKKWLLAGTAAACAALSLAAVAGATGARGDRAGHSARAHPPKLLATAPDDLTGALVRPGFMSFDHSLAGRTPDYLMGPGLTRNGFDHGREPPIVWTAWGARAAGRATYWLGSSNVCRGCQYIRYEVKLAAWRVRDGRYTRFSITVPRGPVLYALEPTRIPANGVPGGLRAHTWCFAKQPKPCVSP